MINSSRPRHSIIIQAYNHERYIDQSIQSVLHQSEPPFEIIIGDDSSSDLTHEIILGYQQKYPEIIKFFPQKRNLGIYQHLNFLCSKVSGDIISVMSADDYIEGEMIMEMNRKIFELNLDPRNEKFILAANHWILKVDGTLTTFSNSHINSVNLFKERLRYGVSYRDCGISIKLFEELEPTNTKIGILADWLWGFDQVVKCDRVIQLPKAFYVYREGIGAISKAKRIEVALSSLEVLRIVMVKYKHLLDTRDLLYIRFLQSRYKFEIDEGLFDHLQFIVLTLLNLSNFSQNNPFTSNLRAFTSILPVTVKKIAKKIFGKNGAH